MNLLNTINNLDKVLGNKNIIVPISKNQIINKKENYNNKLIKKPVNKLNYLSYAEVVNGRCAIIGRFVTPIIYEINNKNLMHQITDDSIDFSIKFIGTIGLISIISKMYFEKYDINNIPETLEDIIGKFFMLNWLYVILMNIIK